MTPNAAVKIKSLKIAPVSAEVFFRKTFDLPDKPVSAHCAFSDAVDYTLYVNGQKASEGTNIYPCGYIKTADLTPYLKKGKNVIAYEKTIQRLGRRSSRMAFRRLGSLTATAM